MKSWKGNSGKLNNFSLVEENIPVVTEKEQVLIEVSHCGMNFADIFACLGLYSATPSGQFTPGLEFSGIVSQVHNDKSHSYKVGDYVMGVTRFGGYASHVLTTFHYIKLIPEGWELEHGASFLCQSLTAWYGLVHLGGLFPSCFHRSHLETILGRKKIVLIQSAAGGVGLWALNICMFSEAIPIAVVGSNEKKRYLVDHHSIDENQIIVRTTAPEFADQIQSCLDWIQTMGLKSNVEGVDIVFDAVAGDYFTPMYTKMSRGGRYIIFGAAHYMSSCSNSPNYFKLAWKYLRRPTIDPGNMITDNKAILGFNLIWMWDQTELMQAMLEDMFHPNLNWNKPVIGERFEFEHAQEALNYFQSGSSIGKIVLDVHQS